MQQMRNAINTLFSPSFMENSLISNFNVVIKEQQLMQHFLIQRRKSCQALYEMGQTDQHSYMK